MSEDIAAEWSGINMGKKEGGNVWTWTEGGGALKGNQQTAWAWGHFQDG